MDTKELEHEWMRASYRMKKLDLSQLFAEVSRNEFTMLEIIDKYMLDNPDAQGIYVSELAKRLNVSSPAVSRKLGVLENKGMIDRTVDRLNRRNTYVFLTDKGKAVRVETRDAVDAFLRDAFVEMDDQDIRQFLILWNQLLDIMEGNLEQLVKGK